MNYILFDGSVRNQLLPFTFTRPVADIRFGILTMREKWERLLETSTSSETEKYLSAKFPKVEMDQNIIINASFVPSAKLVDQIRGLSENQALFVGDEPLAYFVSHNQVVDLSTYDISQYSDDDLLRIEYLWDIFSKNHDAITQDFNLITEGRNSQPIPDNTVAFNPDDIFIEEGAKLPLCSLNAEDGPIYIAKDAVIMEGAMIRGPFALCEGSTVKMGAKIYGGTTIGPFSKVGGEVNNSVIFGYTNKGHDGFLGNSVLAEWCNIGADTNTSNLKNDYSDVRLWDYDSGRFAHTGRQFCGLMMGDHSKCSINTMFNTGTLVGVNANIFGSGFPRNFVPSFSWGGNSGITTYTTKKAFEVAQTVMARREVAFTENDAKILEHIFEVSSQWRKS